MWPSLAHGSPVAFGLGQRVPACKSSRDWGLCALWAFGNPISCHPYCNLLGGFPLLSVSCCSNCFSLVFLLCLSLLHQDSKDLTCGVVGLPNGTLGCHQEVGPVSDSRQFWASVYVPGQATTDCPGLPLLRDLCPKECPFVVPHSYLSFFASFCFHIIAFCCHLIS